TTDCIGIDSFVAKADLITCYIPQSALETFYDPIIEPKIETRSINTIRIDLTAFICGVTDECINRCADAANAPVHAYCDPDPKIKIVLRSGEQLFCQDEV
ncbi:MAG: hypothetical protein K2M66_03115, partial [Alistipes sp.]|nr:hypothetical protein [Alistipes sp.]